MNSDIVTATAADFDYLSARDHHISAEMLGSKVDAGEILIAKIDGAPVGYLRYGYFWDNIPFMNLLWLDEPYRGKGIGTQLVTHWERAMSAQGYTSVLTSTLSNEDAQHFYRKLGYRDVGALLLPDEPLEILLMKSLVS
jgi:ribosomal protein S18 acetylase RimI-like enzyme